MFYKFEFDIPPLSTNKLTRVVSNRIIKSADARIFNKNVQESLRFNQNESCLEIKRLFKAPDSSIELKFRYYTPKLYRKSDNAISAHSKDIDNCLKQYIDSVFNYLEINDVFVTKIDAEKLYAEEEKVEMYLYIVPLKNRH